MRGLLRRALRPLSGLRPPSWRALAITWGAFLTSLGAIALVLAFLGPPLPESVGAVELSPPAKAAAVVSPAGPAPAEPAPTLAALPLTGNAAGPAVAPAATTVPDPVAPAVTLSPVAATVPVPAALPPAAEPTVAAGPGAVPQPSGTEIRIPAPMPAMVEMGFYGPLPRVGADGRRAMQVYARPFDRGERRPKIGIVLGNLGMNAALTEDAIRRLPPSVTLAFSPYATQVTLLLDRARARGMEVMMALPLEPSGYPLNFPGDHGLLTGLTPGANSERLDWVLSRFTGYVGAIGALGPMRGERFAALSDHYDRLQESLRNRGLLYVDPRPGQPDPARVWGRSVDAVIDDPPGQASIEAKLAGLEQLARERGSALGYAGEATPVLLDRLAAWAGSLESRGSVLAPVSALSRKPETTAAR